MTNFLVNNFVCFFNCLSSIFSEINILTALKVIRKLLVTMWQCFETQTVIFRTKMKQELLCFERFENWECFSLIFANECWFRKLPFLKLGHTLITNFPGFSKNNCSEISKFFYKCINWFEKNWTKTKGNHLVSCKVRTIILWSYPK